MQRRTMATFARVCRAEPVSPQWISHPGLRQRCTMAKRPLNLARAIADCGPLTATFTGLGSRCVCDDVNGYGPAGRDFIAHVEFPETVIAAGNSCSRIRSSRGCVVQRSRFKGNQ